MSIRVSAIPYHSGAQNGGTLKKYVHPVAQPTSPGARPEYYTNYLGGWANTDPRTAKTFMCGATAFKNAMDLTRGTRTPQLRRRTRGQVK